MAQVSCTRRGNDQYQRPSLDITNAEQKHQREYAGLSTSCQSYTHLHELSERTIPAENITSRGRIHQANLYHACCPDRGYYERHNVLALKIASVTPTFSPHSRVNFQKAI